MGMATYTEDKDVVIPKSRLITQALTTALKVWLRSQLDNVTDLELKLGGSDRKLLSGTIPTVFLKADKAVYQGLHLSHVEGVAHHIHVNLKQILKGKALRLLEPVPLKLTVRLNASELQRSLVAPLCKTTVLELLQNLLPSQATVVDLQQVRLEANALILELRIEADTTTTGHLILCPNLGAPHELCLRDLVWQPLGAEPQSLKEICFDLGPQVSLKSLTCDGDAIACCGQISILP